MPKPGDFVYYKADNAYGDAATHLALVTRAFTDKDGEWAKGREILSLFIIPEDGYTWVIQADKGTRDDEGNWRAGGWAETPDGPSQSAPVTAAPSNTGTTPALDAATPPTVGDTPAPDPTQTPTVPQSVG